MLCFGFTGFAPLPKNIRLPFSDAAAEAGVKCITSEKPVPPPIETIPKKTQSTKAEKRTRKVWVKSDVYILKKTLKQMHVCLMFTITTLY